MSTASALWFERAQRVIPGGVNSPVRAFDAVGGAPIFVQSAKGTRLQTVDGAELIDFCGSWGPLILGHAPDVVVAAIAATAAQGTTFGISTPLEVELAELLCRQISSLGKVRLVSSGTEAVMTAIRLARGYTGRDKIIKFAGGYHGHSDALLAAAGSGLLTGGISSSAGVPAAVVADTFLPAYNDLPAVEAIVRANGDRLAAIIIEPIAGNMGLVQPQPGFLQGLRQLCDACGALLIFDEVITGFRLAPTTLGTSGPVTPDLTTLGKIIGGGMPIGAVGGRADIMDRLAPLGPVYQAGTLSGNPVAVSAGLATLKTLIATNPYPRLATLGARLADGLTAAAAAAGVPLVCPQVGGMFTPFFTATPVHCLADAKRCDTARYAAFFRAMLARGFYLPPSQFEAAFISAAHTPAEIDAFLHAAAAALAAG